VNKFSWGFLVDKRLFITPVLRNCSHFDANWLLFKNTVRLSLFIAQQILIVVFNKKYKVQILEIFCLD